MPFVLLDDGEYKTFLFHAREAESFSITLLDVWMGTGRIADMMHWESVGTLETVDKVSSSQVVTVG